ncbi:MAG: SMP-30/gluconolactonase/LRE family protein [Acidimicrobiia bacterium]|nr:SMP-30/gluconolactonase/LRE family protein [Acidimicrobiia bacterium]
MHIDVAVQSSTLLGESPVWSVRTGLLWWVDITGKAIHRWSPATGVHESKEISSRPGSLALTGDPDVVLVASEGDLVWFDWSTATSRHWVQLEDGSESNRLNDGRCDPVGRLWVGSMWDPSSDRMFTGYLHRVEPDGRFTTVSDKVGVANGLAFSPTGDTMYFADTPHRTVWAYDYDVTTGARTNERPFVEYGDLAGKPDGACVDADGCYWNAAVRGAALHRFTPAGKLDRTIELPVSMPTMPAFGGPALETLFVTSIGGGNPQEPLAGTVLALDVGVKGIEEPEFSGSPDG